MPDPRRPDEAQDSGACRQDAPDRRQADGLGDGPHLRAARTSIPGSTIPPRKTRPTRSPHGSARPIAGRSPPTRQSKIMIGRVVSRHAAYCKSPPKSLPSTISALERRVVSRLSSVRRSRSWAIAPATSAGTSHNVSTTWVAATPAEEILRENRRMTGPKPVRAWPVGPARTGFRSRAKARSPGCTARGSSSRGEPLSKARGRGSARQS